VGASSQFKRLISRDEPFGWLRPRAHTRKLKHSPKSASEGRDMLAMGKLVYQATGSMQATLHLNLNDLNNGVYFVLVKSEGSLLGTKKIEILK
jgi:hypothetical protein